MYMFFHRLLMYFLPTLYALKRKQKFKVNLYQQIEKGFFYLHKEYIETQIYFLLFCGKIVLKIKITWITVCFLR